MNHDDHEDFGATLARFVTNTATESVQNDGWDIAPGLALVFAHNLADGVGVLETHELPTGDLFAQGFDTLTVVRATAFALKVAPVGSALPLDPWPRESVFIGALFLAETWAVAGENETDPDGLDRVRKWVDEGNLLEDHPDAYEAKSAVLVATNGTVIAATHARHTGETMTSTTDIESNPGGIALTVAYVTAAAHERHEAEQEHAS